MSQNNPMVSCILVAGAEPRRVARAVYCYQQQNWEHKELVVIDCGSQDLSPLLDDIATGEVRYLRPENGEKQSLAKLRNTGLDHAGGELVALWGENDWHHPDRIAVQAEMLTQGVDICWLSSTLMHLDHPEFVHHPYVGMPPGGYTGSLMHRNGPEMRYPSVKKDSDRAFVSLWDENKRKQCGPDRAYLLVRSFSGGSDMRDYKQFLKGIRSGSKKDLARHIWLKVRGKSRFLHRRFKLGATEKQSFHQYLVESAKLGALRSVS